MKSEYFEEKDILAFNQEEKKKFIKEHKIIAD
jgi:hypothetical protein